MRRWQSLVALIAVGGVAAAHERAVKESDVPKPVLAAVAKKYPAAKRIGFAREVEHDKTTFEVKLADGARKIDVDLSPEGKILAEEQIISEGELPQAVKRALAESPKYGKWSVKRVERVVTNENESAPSFEVLVTSGGKKTELVFDQNGKLTQTEAHAGAD